MDTWEERRKKILGVSTQPQQQSQQQSDTSSTWQQRRQKILGQNNKQRQINKPVTQNQQQPQNQNLFSKAQDLLNEAKKVGGNAFNTVQSFVKDLPNQLGGNYAKDIQQAFTSKNELEKTEGVQKAEGDIPLFGGIISGAEKFFGTDFGQSLATGNYINKKQAADQQTQQQTLKMIAKMNQTEDQKEKQRLRKLVMNNLNIPSQFDTKKDIPLIGKTNEQIAGEAIGGSLDLATLPLGESSAKEIEKSFLQTLISKKMIATGVVLGGAYGASGSLEEGQTNALSIIKQAGLTAVTFPATEIVGESATGKLANKIIKTFTKKSIIAAATSKTQEEMIQKEEKIINNGLAKSENSPDVKKTIIQSFEQELRSINKGKTYQEAINDPETGKYTQFLLKKVNELGGGTGSTVVRGTQEATSALQLADKGVYAKVTPEQLNFLKDETKNIPFSQGDTPHLSPLNEKLTSQAKEISLDELRKMSPNANTALSNFEKTTKIEPQPTTLQPTGTGQKKQSKLAQGVDEKAVEHNLTQGLSDLPEYNQVSMKDQAAKSTQLISEDPEYALNIALGKQEPPKGILPESMFVAVEQQALKNGDIETINQLAHGSLSMQATAMGQRIRTLGERNPDSPVSMIQQVSKARQKQLQKSLKGKTINKAVDEESSKIKQEVTKKLPKKDAWEKFMQDITCK